MAESKSPTYAEQTVGSRMYTLLPVCRPTDLHEHIVKKLEKEYQSTETVYVLDEKDKLLGIIETPKLLGLKKETPASEMMHSAGPTLNPHSDQEKAVFMSVKNDDVSLPVVEDGRFLGAITARTIIDIMHQEHLEDSMLSAGIRHEGADVVKLASQRAGMVFRNRLPWLVFGMAMGLSLGLISSFFEATLSKNIALAYFIPVVAYIADSVGTQSEAIAVRGLALLKLNYLRYLSRELLVGLMLGGFLGLLGGIGAAFIGHSAAIGLTVGLSLFVASAVAAVMASLIPFLFRALGKDPALGSGPLATAFQDVISIIIYFAIATLIIH